MPDASYVSLDEIEPADLASCGEGFFQSYQPGMFGNVVITAFEGSRHAVYLDDPKGPLFVPAPAGGGSTRLGILWRRPSIEIDPATLYDPERTQEAAGDLILGTQPMIFAREPDGWFNDGRRIPLWGDVPAAGKLSAVRSWRLVSVAGDRRRVIFAREGKAGGPA
ncbi:hypothetical protein NF701_08990 [Sphingomonadaceae bacterium OTU29THOMA1]|nr:hypothetical protein NF701_08990 [Sphingomonadaceae bacterium OTU29THOMA1]